MTGEQDKFDPRIKETPNLIGELYDDEDFYLDISEFEKLANKKSVEEQVNSMVSLIPQSFVGL